MKFLDVGRSVRDYSLLLIAVGLLGCGATEEKPRQLDSIVIDNYLVSERPAVQGLNRIEVPGGVLYISPDHATESYDDWFVNVPIISFNKRQARLTSTEQSALMQHVLDADVERLALTSVLKAEGPSACTLVSTTHLLNLQLYKSGSHGSQVNFVRSLGRSDLVFEVRDSVDDTVIFVYVTRLKLGSGTTKSGAPDLKRFSEALSREMDRTMANLATAIEFRPEKMESRKHLGCEGKVGKYTQRLLSSGL